LLLLPVGAPVKESECVKKVAAPVVSDFSPCGRAFHLRQFKSAAEAAAKSEASGAESAVADAAREALRTKLDVKGLNLEDYYALMGLEKESWRSTEEQIVNNWKIISFVCHPDKSTPEGRPYGEKRFKAMQLAYSTLTDKQKRIGYDSALPFDESLPKSSQGKTEADFYKVYGPVFERNSRFSTVKPVPVLGDKDSSNDEVNNFYDFWFSFKSWRDFTYLDEHKSDDSTDRYTKRENERKNKKLREGKKKEEMARVRKLVEDAMGKDARMVRIKAEAQAEAKARKQAKKDRFKKNNKVDEAKLAAEAKAKEEAEAAAAKKAAEDTIKKKGQNTNKMVKKVTKMCKNGRAGVFDDVEAKKALSAASYDELEKLVALMSIYHGPDEPMTDAEKKEAKDYFNTLLAKA